MTKKLILSSLLLLLVNCKKQVPETTNHSIEPDTQTVPKKGIPGSSADNVAGSTGKSLVLSCGSGCAMTYNATEIMREGLNIKVTFTVNMYIDEVITETYDETYIFYYDNTYRLKKIVKAGAENEDFLNTQSVSNQKSFTDFAEELVSEDKKAARSSPDKEVPSQYLGDFSVFVETEETTTGMASISYYFTIKKEEAVLETNTYHEPIRCNGKYTITSKGSFIELYYAGNEPNCSSDGPAFEIKKEGQKYLIKGVGNEADSIEWIELKKK